MICCYDIVLMFLFMLVPPRVVLVPTRVRGLAPGVSGLVADFVYCLAVWS